jgi:DNA polymerase-3 subunit delta
MPSPICIIDQMLKPSTSEFSLGKIGVVFGDDDFLRRAALQWLVKKSGCQEEWIHYFDGDTASWVDVHDEVATVSLFDQDEAKVVVVRNATKFISQHRTNLEKWLEKSNSSSLLILETSTWVATTRLYKLVNEFGFAIRGSVPKLKAWGDPPDLPLIEKWLLHRARHEHHLKLTKSQAEKIIDLVGPEFGLLDNEIAKLALFANSDGGVSDQQLSETIGGWRLQTVWTILEEVADGRIAEALIHVDRLLATGESVMALVPQLSWGLRRFGVAAQLIEQGSRFGRQVRIPEALLQAGFRNNDLAKAEKQLRRIGRQRASKLLQWLLETDMKLKGSHSNEGRARFLLEELLLRLSDQSGKVRSLNG